MWHDRAGFLVFILKIDGVLSVDKDRFSQVAKAWSIKNCDMHVATDIFLFANRYLTKCHLKGH